MIHFTIRDLLWLTVVAALLLGWWANNRVMSANAMRLKTDNVSLAEERNNLLSQRDVAMVMYHKAYLEWMSKKGKPEFPNTPKVNLKGVPYQEAVKRPASWWDPPDINAGVPAISSSTSAQAPSR